MIEFEFILNHFDEVEDDIEIAKLWYYEQNPDTDLEERFADAIKDTITKLQKNPFIYYPIFENIRIAHPKFFPYGVHFSINEDEKEILISQPLKRAIFNYHKNRNIIFRIEVEQIIKPKNNLLLDLIESELKIVPDSCQKCIMNITSHAF